MILAKENLRDLHRSRWSWVCSSLFRELVDEWESSMVLNVILYALVLYLYCTFVLLLVACSIFLHCSIRNCQDTTLYRIAGSILVFSRGISCAVYIFIVGLVVGLLLLLPHDGLCIHSMANSSPSSVSCDDSPSLSSVSDSSWGTAEKLVEWTVSMTSPSSK